MLQHLTKPPTIIQFNFSQTSSSQEVSQTQSPALHLQYLLLSSVSSEKLRICQANRRTEPPAVRVGKRKPAKPFFSGTGKNALIITGGWLVR